MTASKRLRVIQALNRLAKIYKGLLPRRDLPHVERVQRTRNFVRMRDIILLLKDLFATRRRSVVHLGLDLYIILLAGQRYLADHTKME